MGFKGTRTSPVAINTRSYCCKNAECLVWRDIIIATIEFTNSLFAKHEFSKRSYCCNSLKNLAQTLALIVKKYQKSFSKENSSEFD